MGAARNRFRSWCALIHLVPNAGQSREMFKHTYLISRAGPREDPSPWVGWLIPRVSSPRAGPRVARGRPSSLTTCHWLACWQRPVTAPYQRLAGRGPRRSARPGLSVLVLLPAGSLSSTSCPCSTSSLGLAVSSADLTQKKGWNLDPWNDCIGLGAWDVDDPNPRYCRD